MSGERPRHRREESQAEALYDRVENIAVGTVIFFAIALFFFLHLIRSILLPFVFAGIVAYVLTPLVRWIRLRTGAPRWVAALAVLLALIALVALACLLGGPLLLDQLSAVAGDLPGTVRTLAQKLMGGHTLHLMGTTIDASKAGSYVVDGLDGWLSAHGQVLNIATWTFAAFFGVILTWVILGYLLFDGPRVWEGLLWLVPPRYRPFTRRVWARLDPILWRYFGGIALVVIYAATAAYVGLGFFLGLKHAVLLALLTGVLEVIPVVGPAASAIIAGLVAVQESSSSWGIVSYALYATALRISIDQFFGPIVLGKAGRVPPVLVIFCFLTGGYLFGVMGVILAVPVALTIRTVLAVLYDEQEGEEA